MHIIMQGFKTECLVLHFLLNAAWVHVESPSLF